MQAIRAAQVTARPTDPIDGSSRLSDMLVRLEKLLSESYAFDVFAKNAINFGIMVTYRQTWEPQQYQVGDLVKHDPARSQGSPQVHDARRSPRRRAP